MRKKEHVLEITIIYLLITRLFDGYTREKGFLHTYIFLSQINVKTFNPVFYNQYKSTIYIYIYIVQKGIEIERELTTSHYSNDIGQICQD